MRMGGRGQRVAAVVAVLALLASGCGTSQAALRRLSLGQPPGQVQRVLGPPLRVSAERQGEDHVVRWDYRLYQYEGAIEGVSPFFDIFTLTFVNGQLQRWERTGGATAEDFARAGAFMAGMAAAGAGVSQALTGVAPSPSPSSGFSAPAPAPAPVAAPATGTRLLVFGGPGHRTFLGCLNCSAHDPASVLNTYGEFGSRYGTRSLHNPYGDFGSKYANTSACGRYASDPPVVVDDSGTFYGRLTLNPNAGPVASPRLLAWLTGVCSG